MSARAIRTWTWWHKWTSLICTLFMLMLCLTGLPLIFHHEIGHLLGDEIEAPPLTAAQAHLAETPPVSLDVMAQAAKARYPDRVIQFAGPSEDDPHLWWFTMTPTPAPTNDYKSIAVDTRTGLVVGDYKVGEGFMDLMLRLHVDMFAGLPGKLFLGFMGLLLLVALVSGVVLYAPFMRKLAFGEVRRERSTRIKWLDLHNLMGIVTLVWCFVVGATGMINTWADLLVKYWQYDQLSALLAPYKDEPVTPMAQRGSLQQAMDNAVSHAPDMKVSFIAFPGTAYSSPHHNTVLLKGSSPLKSRLLAPMLMDAKTGALTAAPELPWYLTALLVSQPLHFGDYGGMPMKVLWALLDVATLLVLGSGVYLWLRKPQGARRKAGAPATAATLALEEALDEALDEAGSGSSAGSPEGSLEQAPAASTA
ncbi:PepSY-associated TM helix domain-containing protein [Roseateles sp. SL47]|uniref:PepSY-associated TM helix domain-containing protein n=1 Tax=Roseateles sp. SL47 TaxID=2995138 RepID=UPI00226D8F72|nr:PepSY-associated TM helix domain-containing protein [Roseateles sp. SL47]WAC76002.1 PepSY-associated TM helix domain-containing protein [Roseateles sp. SL47]